MKRALIGGLVTAAILGTIATPARADGPSGGCVMGICNSQIVITHKGGGGGGQNRGGHAPAPAPVARPQSGNAGASVGTSGSVIGRPAVGNPVGASLPSALPSIDPSVAVPFAQRPVEISSTYIDTKCVMGGLVCLPVPTTRSMPWISPSSSPAAAATSPSAGANAQPATAPAPPPVPTAAQWTEAVRAQMKLTSPTIGSAPCAEAGCMGAVGVPVWLWATNLEDKGMTITLGPYSVTAKASVSGMSFNLGDGRSISCTGTGTPYDTSRGWASSPDCGTTYDKKGRYTVTANATWHVTWSGVDTGDLDIPATSSTTLTIGEYQALTQ